MRQWYSIRPGIALMSVIDSVMDNREGGGSDANERSQPCQALAVRVATAQL